MSEHQTAAVRVSVSRHQRHWPMLEVEQRGPCTLTRLGRSGTQSFWLSYEPNFVSHCVSIFRTDVTSGHTTHTHTNTKHTTHTHTHTQSTHTTHTQTLLTSYVTYVNSTSAPSHFRCCSFCPVYFHIVKLQILPSYETQFFQAYCHPLPARFDTAVLHSAHTMYCCFLTPA